MTPTWLIPLWLALMLAVALWIVQAVPREAMGFGGEDGDGS